MPVLVSAGWGHAQSAAAAAGGALLGPFRLHVHSAGGRRTAVPQRGPPPRTRQLHFALVHYVQGPGLHWGSEDLHHNHHKSRSSMLLNQLFTKMLRF